MPRIALAIFFSILFMGTQPSAEQRQQSLRVRFQSCRDTMDYPCCSVSKTKVDEAIVGSLLQIGTRAFVERELQEKGKPRPIRDEAIRRGREVYVVIEDPAFRVQSPVPVDVVARLEEVEEEARKQRRDMFYVAVEKHDDKAWSRKPTIPAGAFTANWGVFRYRDGEVTDEVPGDETYCVFRSRETTVVEYQYAATFGCAVDGSESGGS